ncbi:hypothetical protein J490_1050 [Acinetobacter baumannii 942194]|nr:hypothetical protein J490_1050 [Acinetobacter baumannii 942194]
MARKIEYSEEIWNRLKEVYESSPKITWQALVDQVGEELGCEMPSPSVVRRKALAEKWKKKAKSLVKKTAQELNKDIKKLTKKIMVKKIHKILINQKKVIVKIPSKKRQILLNLIVKTLKIMVITTAGVLQSTRTI